MNRQRPASAPIKPGGRDGGLGSGATTSRGGQTSRKMSAHTTTAEPQPDDDIVRLPLPDLLYQWRFMIFFHSLDDMSHQLKEISITSPLYIEYKVFGETRKIPLNPAPLQSLEIDQMRIHYLFSDPPLISAIMKEEQLCVNVCQEIVVNNSAANENTNPTHEDSIVSPFLLAKSNPAEAAKIDGKSCYIEKRIIASGSCLLERLAHVHSSKQPTYMMLFSSHIGNSHLKITLGLTRDIQVPSQYCAVTKLHDAFVPIRPYTSCMPIPEDWLSCFSSMQQIMLVEPIEPALAPPLRTISATGSVSGAYNGDTPRQQKNDRELMRRLAQRQSDFTRQRNALWSGHSTLPQQGSNFTQAIDHSTKTPRALSSMRDTVPMKTSLLPLTFLPSRPQQLEMPKDIKKRSKAKIDTGLATLRRGSIGGKGGASLLQTVAGGTSSDY